MLIVEFRRPEFEVATRPGPGRTQRDDPFTVDRRRPTTTPAAHSARHRHLAGDCRAATYSPPGWDGFQFGRWTPWWDEGDFGFGDDMRPSRGPCCGPARPTCISTAARPMPPADDTCRSTSVTSGGRSTAFPWRSPHGQRVQDVNRQALARAPTLLCTPPTSTSVCAATAMFVARRLDGRRRGRHRHRWHRGRRPVGRDRKSQRDGRFENGAVDRQAGRPADVRGHVRAVRRCRAAHHRCRWHVPIRRRLSTIGPGQPQRADALGRLRRGDPRRTVESRSLTVVPDSREYQPGDTA